MDTSQIIGGLAALVTLVIFFAMSIVPLFTKQLPQTEEGAE